MFVQASLLACGPVGVSPHADWLRTPLPPTSWVDVARGFVLGADDLLARCVEALPLTQGRRLMWGEWVDEPRVSCSARATELPEVGDIGRALTARYRVRFDSCFANLYRTGTDSVAWHSDDIGARLPLALVAIVSLGGPRALHLRPTGGGPATKVVLHSGDALVMGGACQQEYQHCVPKVARAQPRLSLSFRHSRPVSASEPT